MLVKQEKFDYIDIYGKDMGLGDRASVYSAGVPLIGTIIIQLRNRFSHATANTSWYCFHVFSIDIVH